MFEEDKFNRDSVNIFRKIAQLKHCRLKPSGEAGIMKRGQCVCECPAECRFEFPEKYTEDSRALFPDIREWIRQVWSE